MEYERELRDRATDLGLDPDEIFNTTETGQTQFLADFDFKKHVVIRYEPVAPGSSEAGDYETIEDLGDVQMKTVVKKRPQCPTCNYLPIAEDDPLHLPGECWECEEPVCPECGVDCEACGHTMCPTHARGHGLETEALCRRCIEVVEDEVRHRRTMKRLKKAKQWREVTLNRQNRRFQNRLKAKRLQLQLLKIKEGGEIEDPFQSTQQPRSVQTAQRPSENDHS